jgi:cell filamentation protein
VSAPRDGNDPYAYPGTNVVRNHALTIDPEHLEKVERRAALRELTKLQEHPVRGHFDVFHVADIHARIFKEVYPFAGEFRQANSYVAKNDPRTNIPFPFPLPEMVVPYLNETLKRHVSDHNYLRGLSKTEFSSKASEVLIQLHTAHPMRDGNSRTVREFTRTLAMNAGYELDWDRVKREELLPAIFAYSFNENDRKLPSLIKSALVNPRADPEISARYLATATGPDRPWRGSIGQALTRSAQNSPSQALFVDAGWEQDSRVRLWSHDEVQAILEKTQKAIAVTSSPIPAKFSTRELGAVYDVATNKDLFLRLDQGRTDYPEKIQHAMDRHLEKTPALGQPTRTRTPDIDIE